MPICKVCNQDGDHYTWTNAAGEKVPFPKCKACHNVGKYQKKPTGWHKLPPATVDQICERLSDRRNTVKDVAKEFDLSASTLASWIRKGLTSLSSHLDE